MCPDCPSLSWEPTNIGMASGTLEVDHISRVVAIGVGTYNSLGHGKHHRQVWLQRPEPVGCVGQGCLDSCLKTQTRLMFRVIGMAGLIYRHEENSSGYEKMARMRLLLKFLSLDIVSHMVLKFPGDFMGNGRVLLSGGLASSKDFGVILWDGRSPWLCCC